jgi:hypothetical protein
MAVLVKRDKQREQADGPRVNQKDTLRFRGMARVIPSYRGLLLIVDTVETVDS